MALALASGESQCCCVLSTACMRSRARRAHRSAATSIADMTHVDAVQQEGTVLLEQMEKALIKVLAFNALAPR